MTERNKSADAEIAAAIRDLKPSDAARHVLVFDLRGDGAIRLEPRVDVLAALRRRRDHAIANEIMTRGKPGRLVAIRVERLMTKVDDWDLAALRREIGLEG